MQPLISVLIPAHNAEHWIADAMASAVHQTWQRHEVIVVDDGSTDKTLRIAQSFASPNVKVISQPQSGACRARNRAFRHSQGEFIQWLDADDLLAPNKVEQQMRAYQSAPDSLTLMSAAWARFYCQVRHAKFHSGPLWQDLDPLTWLLVRLGQAGMMAPHAWLVSRELTEKTGPWDEKLHRNQDGEYFCRVVANSRFVRFVPNAGCYYRRVIQASISKNDSPEALESIFRSFDLCSRYLLSLEDSPRTRKVCARLFFYYASRICATDSGLHEEANQKIEELGETIPQEPMSRNQEVARALLGEARARRIGQLASRVRHLAASSWDCWLSRFAPPLRVQLAERAGKGYGS